MKLVACLARAGYDLGWPLKRVIQRELQNPLASQILEGRIREGDAVHVTAGDHGLVIDDVEAAAA